MLPVLGINFKFWYSADRDGDVEFYEDSEDEGSVLIQSKGRPKEWDWILNEYVELMQYTGLHDKHGKEICEGDILKHKIDFVTQVNHYIVKDMRELYLDFYRDNTCCRITMTEIIGNIHQNPELLEVE